MDATGEFSRERISAALADLDQLAREEYGKPLEALLVLQDGQAALRVQRLVGVAFKRRFTEPAGQDPQGLTGALRSWPWADDDSPPSMASATPQERRLLEKLREPGPWNGWSRDGHTVSWRQFKDEVQHERGLFKVIALYASDRLKGHYGRPLDEYLAAQESRRFEGGLDLAVLLFDAGICGPLVAALGVPAVAVGVALVAFQYGYRKLTDPEEDRHGDNRN